MSHKVAQGFVSFGLSLPTIGLAWLGCLASGAGAAGAAGGQRVETFQKTQYILCMGWDGMEWRWSKAFFMIINNSNSPAAIAVADFQNPKLPFSEQPSPPYFSVSL